VHKATLLPVNTIPITNEAIAADRPAPVQTLQYV